MTPLAFGASIILASSAFAQPGTPPALVDGDRQITVRELAAIIAERDRQYEQRFETLQKAIDTSAAIQDKATEAKFTAAEKAVASALAAQEKATAAAFVAANTAVSKAEIANEKRLDSVNEFRSQLKDQASTLATRNEVSVQVKSLTEALDAVRVSVTEIRSKSEGSSTTWALMLAIGGLVIGAIVAFLGYSKWREPTIIPRRLDSN